MEAKIVKISEVLSPDRFLVSDSNLKEVLEISNDIKNVLEMGTMAGVDSNIVINEIYCCFFEGLYHRVKIEQLDNSMAICDFLDSHHPMRSISIDKLSRLPSSLIGRPRLKKEVTLRGIAPHSLLVTHDLKLIFGPSNKYDESAVVFVKGLVSKSPHWLCVAKRGSFESSSAFQADLFYVLVEDPPKGKDGIRSVVVGDEIPSGDGFLGMEIPLSEVGEWSEEHEDLPWLSLNRVLVEERFACLKENVSIENFQIYLTRRSDTAPNILKSDLSLKDDNKLTSVSETTREVPGISFTGTTRGRGRGSMLKLNDTPPPPLKLLKKVFSMTNFIPLPEVYEDVQSVKSDETIQCSNRAKNLYFEAPKLPPKENFPEMKLSLHEPSPDQETKTNQCPRSSQSYLDEKPPYYKGWSSNPRSRMVFKCKDSSIVPHMVNDLVKVCPDELMWLDIPHYIERIKELKISEFYHLIKKDKYLSTMTTPTALQSYAWPAISNLFDFFGVGPSPMASSPENWKGGKSISYILPILSQLNHRECYTGLNSRSQNPLVIIVCPSSRHVMAIHEQVSSLLKHLDDLPNIRIDITVTYLFGMCEEAKQVASMRRGSHICICTPDCLLRMFDKGATSFDNLCHLILEEADILLDSFKPQVERIMDGFQLALMNRCSGVFPRQILVFSQQSTPDLRNFVAKHLTDPVVVMVTMMEAFYSSGVDTMLKYVKNHNSYASVGEVLDKQLSLDNKTKQKMVVFTDTVAKATHMFKWLLRSGHEWASNLKLVTSFEDLDEDMKNKDVILVTSDEMLEELMVISDVTCVVHENVPIKQHVLASRLWLMRDHFHKINLRATEMIKSGDNCSTILLLREEMTSSSRASNIATFLKRAGLTDLPAELEGLKNKPSNNVAQLCNNFKSFGFCSNHLHCKQRHVFSQKLDESKETNINIPLFSIVKIRVTNIKSPFLYNAQIIEWVEQRKMTNHHNDAKLLAIQLARQYGRPGNKVVQPENLEVNELYAWKAKSGVTFRAKVVQMEEGNVVPSAVRILLVDVGDEFEVDVKELLELKEDLKKVSHQAFEVCVCRLKTVDKDPNWNYQDKLFVERTLGISILTGRVVFKAGNILWLDPLEECDKLNKLNIWSTTLDVRRSLLNKGVAEENPEHIRFLLNASNDLDISEVLKREVPFSFGYSCQGLFLTTSVERLTETFTPVYLSAINNPKSLFLTKVVHEERLEKLHSDIEKSFQLEEIKPVGSTQLGEDALLLVWDVNGSRWKRAKVKTACSPEEEWADVFCLDFGVFLSVDRRNIFNMPSRFREALPFQAIECFLCDLEPCPEANIFEDFDRSEALYEAAMEIEKSTNHPPIPRIIKPHGTSVDPGDDDDDDEDDSGDKNDKDDSGDKRNEDDNSGDIPVGTNRESDTIEALHLQKFPSHQDITITSSEVQQPSNCSSPNTPLKWADDVEEFLMNLTRDEDENFLLTAELVCQNPASTQPCYGVRLHGYNSGDFVCDLQQAMVVERKAALAEYALDGMLDSIEGPDCVIKEKCKKFIMEEDPIRANAFAKDILLDVTSSSESKHGCKGLVEMLALSLKFNRHWLNFEPILKALEICFDSKTLHQYDHCSEARHGYLWDSICFHLSRKRTPMSPDCSKWIIIKHLLNLLDCETCCEDFINKGGIKITCVLMNNHPTNELDILLGFILLSHMLKILLRKSREKHFTINKSSSGTYVDEDADGDEDEYVGDEEDFNLILKYIEEHMMDDYDYGEEYDDNEMGDGNYEMTDCGDDEKRDGDDDEKKGGDDKESDSDDEKKDGDDEKSDSDDEKKDDDGEESDSDDDEKKDGDDEKKDGDNDEKKDGDDDEKKDGDDEKRGGDDDEMGDGDDKERNSGDDEMGDGDYEMGDGDDKERNSGDDKWDSGNDGKRGGDDNDDKRYCSDDDDGDGMRGMSLKARFLQHHKEINMHSKKMKNISRDVQFDFMRCMEAIAMTLNPEENEVIARTSACLLNFIIRRVDDIMPCIQTLKRTGGLDNMVDILSKKHVNAELLKDVLNLLSIVATQSCYIRDYLRRKNLYDIASRINKEYIDEEMFEFSSNLIHSLHKNKTNVALTTSSDVNVVANPKAISQATTRATPIVYWSNIGATSLRLRVEARQVIPETLNVIYTENSVSFKAHSDTIEYSFHLQFKRSIIPLECKAVVHSSEVMIFIIKEEPRIWKRISATKNFSVRFDLVVLENEMKQQELKEKDDAFDDLQRFALANSDSDSSEDDLDSMYD